MRHICFGLFFLSILLAAGCNSDHPNVSSVPLQFSFKRFDRDFFALDTAHLEAGLQKLSEKYPDFLPFYIQEVAHDPTNPNETPLDAVYGFLSAPQVRRLNDSCQAAFADTRKLEKDLEQMLRYYKYYFPQKPAPRIVTAVTEFIGDAYVVNDSLLMIGIDMFMGPQFSGYDPNVFPQYLIRQFSPEFIPAKSALALATRIVGPPQGDRILDHMINNGKILFVMKQLLPETPDSLITGYTRADMEGCYANEQNVWAKLLEMKVLYEPLNSKNQKIVNPSPKADNVFTEAPGEIGNWVGWQIVKAYMKRHPNASVMDMINQKDSQKFLEAARYKPERKE